MVRYDIVISLETAAVGSKAAPPDLAGILHDEITNALHGILVTVRGYHVHVESVNTTVFKVAKPFSVARN